MNTRKFKDPTADDGDFVPLEPGEAKMIVKYFCLIAGFLLAVTILIIKLWK